MDLKTSCGLVLFLLFISIWTVEVTSWPERTPYRSLREGLDNGVNEGNDVQDGDEGHGAHYHHSDHHHHHHHHHHHRSSSSHLRIKPSRNLTHSRSEDGIGERGRSTNPDRDILRRDSEPTGSTRQDSIRRGLKWSGTSASVGARGTSRNKLRGHRGAKSWRRHGTPGRIPSMRTRQDDDYEYDDDSGGEGRHAYLMTTNERPEDKLNEDDVINWAFDKHMRPPQHKGHQETETAGTETAALEASSAKEDVAETDGSSFNTEKEDSEDQLKHDVYAYQLPSDLWFIVRYAKDADGHVEKYMNIVDSFTNYLDKLEEGVRTVSVNVKGVETVFRLTPKHKPFHRPPSSS